jgi:hypothetical protein
MAERPKRTLWAPNRLAYKSSTMYRVNLLKNLEKTTHFMNTIDNNGQACTNHNFDPLVVSILMS